MRIAVSLSGLALAALAGAAVAPPAASAAPPAAPHNVRGTIASASATSLTVTTAGGSVKLALSAKTGVAGVVPATLADVKPGTFIGTANVPTLGSARALEVVVFPDAMRGTGEGDYAWDLPAPGHRSSAMTNGTVSGGGSSMTNGSVSGGGSSMTNGTVAGGGSMTRSSMTNATVSKVSAGAQRTVSLSYKGGTKRVVIPAGVPVVRVVPGSKSLLVPGAHVFVVPTGAAGQQTAAFVVVGERGAVPPM